MATSHLAIEIHRAAADNTCMNKFTTFSSMNYIASVIDYQCFSTKKRQKIEIMYHFYTALCRKLRFPDWYR